jgi:hypothetical protein
MELFKRRAPSGAAEEGGEGGGAAPDNDGGTMGDEARCRAAAALAALARVGLLLGDLSTAMQHTREAEAAVSAPHRPAAPRSAPHRTAPTERRILGGNSRGRMRAQSAEPCRRAPRAAGRARAVHRPRGGGARQIASMRTAQEAEAPRDAIVLQACSPPAR